MIERKFDTLVQQLKSRVLAEVARDYWDGTLEEKKRFIPKMISPGPKSTMRCCIYKERAIVTDRIYLALGGDKNNPNLLEVIEAACDSCPFGGMTVTDMCRGCLAHRCEQACRLNAISFGSDLRCIIDKNKCVNCGLCAKACQFGAIVDKKRPCEAACKINAIHPREDGITEIDNSKCVQCGQCSYACPFGAIMDKSFITKCIDILKGSDGGRNYKTYIIVAPSICSQFHYAKLGQVVTGMHRLGFTNVLEAALGADLVAYNEAGNLAEEGSCTSSCCPAFVKYAKNNYPTLKDKISHNLSPMAAIARHVKRMDPTCKTVFVGPCIAKKNEMFRPDSAPFVDCVITFEELEAMFDAKSIVLNVLEETELDNASYFGRIFARSGGLSEAVAQALKERGSDFEVKPVKVSGLDQCRSALNQMKTGRLPGNFIEGMACPGGCIGGPACLTHEVRDAADVDRYGKTSSAPTITDAINGIHGDATIASNADLPNE
ncbi:MAG: 4Fe-4S dicluster domain-containing protein [Bacilli bacterium]|nr:4Fe-4S dicluster domain-containing protein [Bacilli bacterium]